MKISVLMITYNHEKFVRQAVESVLMQETNFEYELVIGEDCSSDGTRDILLELREAHPDIIRLVLQERNLGMQRNFASTFKACGGRYVALLEGDDYWTSPHKLQKQADFLDSHPDCALCFHTALEVYEDAGRPPRKFPPGCFKEISSIEDLLARNFMHTCSVMFRAGLFAEFPGWFYELTMGDWPLQILNAEHGKIGYIDEVMSAYRVHPQGAWSPRREPQRIKDTIKMLEHVDRHLSHKHAKTINIPRWHYLLALSYANGGDWSNARRYAARYISMQSPKRGIHPKSLLLALLLAYATPAYKLLRNLKKLTGSRPDALDTLIL